MVGTGGTKKRLLAAVLVAVFCGVTFCSNVLAQDEIVAPKPKAKRGVSIFTLGLGIRMFDYAEDLVAPDKSTEKGWLPSVHGSYEYVKPSKYYFKVFGEYASANITYDGSTQDGTPVSFDNSRNAILQVEADAGVIFDVTTNFHLIPYTGLGFKYWQRGEAQTTNRVASYREDYSWAYVPVGVKFSVPIAKNWNLGGTAAAHIMFAGKMTAKMSDAIPGWSDMSFDLGAKMGWYFDLPLTYRASRDVCVSVTPFYEVSSIGKSNEVPAVVNGVNIGTAYEPASNTKQYGLRIGVSMTF